MSAEGAGDRLRIGVDLGGTKIEVLALDGAGRDVFRRRIPTPPSYEAILVAIADLADAADRNAAPRGSVGVGAPGSRSPATGLWRNSNIDACNGRDLSGDLAALLGRPVRVENDANCFVLSEANDGAGAGAWIVYGVTVGTGLGGGVAVGGVLNRGANGAAGETGHVPLPWLAPEDFPLPRCYCGLDGCAELYLSGTGLARDYAAAAGRTLAGPEIVARAEAGEPQAAAAMSRLHLRFARFLSVIVNLLDPDVIVVGGGLSQAPRFCENIAPLVPAYTFARDISVRVVPARHGDASGVRGAARLWDAA
jgi:predicted NBD/HSP70 family sugar kinase